MPATLETAHLAVCDLIRLFQANQQTYLSPQYQEAEARKDFIDKFFKALGWDVDHDTQTNPAEQEVKIERGVAVAAAQKRADYAFYAAPNFRDVRFFVEAKKPSVELDRNADAYFQTLRYGWNANTPLAVLTDFEQFHVLDCRAKPDIRDALKRAHKTYRYTEFLDRETFAEVYWLFSREAFAEGAFDRYVAKLPKPKDVAKQKGFVRASFLPVDASFLTELEAHRETLAKAFKRDNPQLDGFTLTEVTQRVLDRLVFLRFLEDKLIETEISVGGFARSGSAWRLFVDDSRRLNARYNGAVYKSHPLIDTGRLAASEDDFRAVCEALSAQYSPYDFNAIPIHILGSIYERFLGKVIVATEAGAAVEEKPEVRKAGGVYYTPEYIVRYIVDATVGAQIKDKTPDQIAKLRFADIACGSGSFLLNVFDTLLRYHTHWFNDHPERAGRAGCVETDDGTWRLSLQQRRQILLNNVYGVDIDRQAVEVTQISLYLKLLEEETTASAHQYELQLHETLLPDLRRNIMCGNSLIGTDILEGQIFATEQERALNPMNFEDAFPEVMRQGGFDAIVGNPPYIRIQTLNETNPHAVAYFGRNYRAAGKGNYDIYVVFVERALALLNKSGLMGYILPHKFFNAKYGAGLRGLIAAGKHLAAIVHFGDKQVFEGATTYTCLLFVSRQMRDTFEFAKVVDLKTWSTRAVAGEAPSSVVEGGMLDSRSVSDSNWSFSVGKDSRLLERLLTFPVKLEDVTVRIFQGLKTGADSVFVVEQIRDLGPEIHARSQALNAEVVLEKTCLRTLVKGGNSRPYLITPSSLWIIFPYGDLDGRMQLISEEEAKRDIPKTWEYLLRCKAILDLREGGRWNGPTWYGYSRNQALDIIGHPKLFTPDLAERPSVSEDTNGSIAFTGGVAGGYGLIPREPLAGRYLLGLLNSRLMAALVRNTGTQMRGGYWSFEARFIRKLPIPNLDLANPADKAKHDRMVQLVEQMQDAKKKQAAAQSEADTDYWTRRCDAIDRQIDWLVYELYGLTDEEIAIIEGR